RARAIECQSWMLAAAQVGSHGGGRVSFGHSLAVDPWGRVRLDLGEAPAVGVVDLDPAVVADVRARLPSLEHRRELVSRGGTGDAADDGRNDAAGGRSAVS
ncbi:MAG TPA: nitrilase-related carbon-nitrogen hydrolase, partial [Pseudomonadales bacterium]|nr:nitrilase-related carbon-nitrogen hydrolase [Pseudomonadales bacterium]